VGSAHHARGSGVIWEVFRQERKGQAFAHAGSVEAPDEVFAEWYAREQYGRRGESVALWVVPRSAVHEIEEFVDELQKNYHRVDGYPLKEKLAKARERVSTKNADAFSAGTG
jgi:phenylacetate-CoA oxygenase PaaH subunit